MNGKRWKDRFLRILSESTIELSTRVNQPSGPYGNSLKECVNSFLRLFSDSTFAQYKIITLIY